MSPPHLTRGQGPPVSQDGPVPGPAPRPADAAGGAPPSGERAVPEGLQPLLTPALPAVLIVGLPAGDLETTLSRLGCDWHLATAANVLDVAAQLGRFDLVLLAPEVVTQSEGQYIVRDLQAVSPNARMLLVGAAAELSTRILVDAIRAGVADVLDPEDAIGLHSILNTSLQTAGGRAERVLAIGAHPDDVEIGCAGTLLEHRRRGDTVSILTLSHGGVGGDVQARVHESEATARSLGAGLMLGDLPDTRIDPGVETIRIIEAVVAVVDPTIIYVHSARDHHQDHRAVNAAAISASRRVPQVFAYQSPSATNDFLPNKFVAIDSVVVRKVELLSLFDSQSERSYLEPEMIVASARYWARNLAPRAKYAEPFEIIRSLTPSVRRPAASANGSAVAPVLPLSAPSKDLS